MCKYFTKVAYSNISKGSSFHSKIFPHHKGVHEPEPSNTLRTFSTLGGGIVIVVSCLAGSLAYGPAENVTHKIPSPK